MHEIVILDPLSFPWEELRAEHVETPTALLVEDLTVEHVVRHAAGAAKWYLFHTDEDRIFTTLDEAREFLATDLPAQFEERSQRKAVDGALLEALRRELEAVSEEYAVEDVVLRVCGPNTARWIQPLRHMPRSANTSLLELWPVTDDSCSAVATDTAPLDHENPDPHVILVRVDTSLDRRARSDLLAQAWNGLVAGAFLMVVAQLTGSEDEPALEGLLDDVMGAAGGAATLEEFRVLRLPGDSVADTVLLRFCSLSTRGTMRGGS